MKEVERYRREKGSRLCQHKRQAEGCAHQRGEQNDSRLVCAKIGGGKIEDGRDADGEDAEQANRNHNEFYRSRHIELDQKKRHFVVHSSTNQFDDGDRRW